MSNVYVVKRFLNTDVPRYDWILSEKSIFLLTVCERSGILQKINRSYNGLVENSCLQTNLPISLLLCRTNMPQCLADRMDILGPNTTHG